MSTRWGKTLTFFTCGFILPLCCFGESPSNGDSAGPGNTEKPTVMVAMLVRNKEHSLPFTLNYLEKLNYPKDRMSIWIHSDHNIDDSNAIVSSWIRNVKHLYHDVDFTFSEDETGYDDQKGPCDWSRQRFTHVIDLRQKALDTARQRWADYLFMMDADVVLWNDDTLNQLIVEQKPVIAPMLNTTVQKYYSNYWCGMTEKGYYKRGPYYFEILDRHLEGCVKVPMVHSAILINLRHKSSRSLAYDSPPSDYNGPLDDIIMFAVTARHHDVAMFILNKDFYGFLPSPLGATESLSKEREQFSHIVMQAAVEDVPLKPLPYVNTIKTKDKLGFDKVYMINLVRRPDRKEKMDLCFDELGVQYSLVEAVDGKKLNNTYLKDLGIQMLPNFKDPYGDRPLTMGEIGCFLSHYNIWQDIVKNGYRQVAVFEDDIRFKPYFRTQLENVMHEVKTLNLPWDLIYLGRKKLNHKDEHWLDGADVLVRPSYSYWTLSYLLSHSGATKLLQQEPLKKMVPVDEYLPIMFDRHTTDEWKLQYEPRDLQAFSAEPLLVEPTHYTGEPGYITDTENSDVIEHGTEAQGPKTEL